MATIEEVQTARIISSGNHTAKLAKAREVAAIRSQLKAEEPPKPNFKLMSKMRGGLSALKSNFTTAPSSAGINMYTEWSGGIKGTLLSSYNRSTINTEAHLKKLHESRDIDNCFKELVGQLSIESPLLALPTTMASISLQEYLSGAD